MLPKHKSIYMYIYTVKDLYIFYFIWGGGQLVRIQFVWLVGGQLIEGQLVARQVVVEVFE